MDRKEKDFKTQMTTAAQAIATSAIGQLVNQGVNADALHRFTDME